MKALDVVGSGIAKAAAAVKRVITTASPSPMHVCDGFHCDCERRGEVAARSRESAGAWLPGRSGWLKRERE